MNADVKATRTILCDLLESLTDDQWRAETLCDGWDAGDMAAHLIVREREPIAAAGIVVSPLEFLHDKRMASRKRRGRRHLQTTLRSGPTPWMTLGPMAGVQIGEDWIHTEDIRRGGAGLPGDDGTSNPRIMPALWKAVGRFAPMTLRGVDVDGVVAFTDGETTRSYRVGGKVARSEKAAAPDVTITGPVGELVLFATGRRDPHVVLAGDERLIAALEGSDRSF